MTSVAAPGVLVAHPALAYPALLVLFVLGLFARDAAAPGLGPRIAKVGCLLLVLALFMLGARELLPHSPVGAWVWLSSPLWATLVLGFVVAGAGASTVSIAALFAWMFAVTMGLCLALEWALGAVGLGIAHDLVAGLGLLLVLATQAFPKASPAKPSAAIPAAPEMEPSRSAEPEQTPEDAARDAELKQRLASEQAQEAADKYTRE